MMQDFYRVLKIHRTASQNEVKDAYRKLAMALHPDRHNGCEKKAGEFKKATEAYTVLSDRSSRSAHDKTLSGYVNKNRSTRPPTDYRKVYAPRPPPGFKTFNAKKHYDMHYGDGMMHEEIEKARKRAEKASGRAGGYDGEYQSPLGRGFDFETGSGGNPFSKSGRKNPQNGGGGFGKSVRVEGNFEYEEGYMDMSQSKHMSAKRQIRGREIVAERMKERRKFRRRNRGDPLPGDRQDEACVVM
jgi:curved DNA-binding protein CbpA